MTVTHALDLRTLPLDQRTSEALRAFDALASDEAFLLVDDRDPRTLLHRLQAERPRRFEWSVLEAGPARFRVELRRRARDDARNVSEYLEADHRRLDAIVPVVQRLIDGAAFAAAAERFGEFSCGLSRHIDVEEQVLFPAFEQATGMTGGGPTFVMRSEHVEIRRRMAAVSDALAEADAAARDALDGLVEALSIHNMKEERMLYPMSDRAAGSDEARDDLVRRLQTW